MSRRSGLGRGLGSLIPGASTAGSDSRLREVAIEQIRPNRFQPRQHFDEEALSSLVDSIKAVGILQPVLVRETAEGEFELIAGERRFRAARRAGLASVPALVQSADDAASLEQALVENLHREDLNALDEAGAYQQLIEDFSLTHDEVAKRVGKSRATVTNALRLFQLPPAVQRHVRDGRLSAGHARALLGTPDRAAQERLAHDTIAGGLSVRAVEERVRALMQTLEAEASLLEIEAEADAAARTRGSGDAPPPRPPSGSATSAPPSRLRPPGVLDLEELLGDHLNTRVTVDMGGKRGRVVIEFATLDDLERIYRVIIGEQQGSQASQPG